MNGAIQVLRVEIASDRDAFLVRVEELASLPLDPSTSDPGIIARAAVALHHAYGAFEAALARVARVFGTEPSGTNWHRSLLETMALEIPGVRPAIVVLEALEDLRELLLFRHFFRHAYQTRLDPSKLAALRDRALRARPHVAATFARLDTWLEAIAARG
ncbi:MAG: hypothetical protein FJ265_10060 [Planctomycetes bacterium]|nr:hypothetical protein [Planctomycetota bacterium]